jgi:hypothetical protein
MKDAVAAAGQVLQSFVCSTESSGVHIQRHEHHARLVLVHHLPGTGHQMSLSRYYCTPDDLVLHTEPGDHLPGTGHRIPHRITSILMSPIATTTRRMIRLMGHSHSHIHRVSWNAFCWLIPSSWMIMADKGRCQGAPVRAEPG